MIDAHLQELGGNAAAKTYAYHMGFQLLMATGEAEIQLQIGINMNYS